MIERTNALQNATDNAKGKSEGRGYSAGMKRFIIVAASLVMGLLVVPVVSNVQSASAAPVGVFIYNTPLASNTGLGFCAPGTVKGCIESITIDGNELTPVSTREASSYGIGGGLYSGPCRFVETTVSQCEYPYLVLYPTWNGLGQQPALNNVVVNFRRQMNTHPTSAVNSVIVNGALQSFTPAAPNLRDVATINVNSVEIHSASSGYCLGWVTEIDNCAIGETGNSKVTNRVAMLLLPAMRSSVVPPEAVDEWCRANTPMNSCLTNVFDGASRGGWVDTDASVFGLTSTDRYTGAAQLKVAGPHYKTPVNGASELNLAYFRMFMPTQYLSNSFGLAPNEANAVTLPVKRTTWTGSTTPVTQYIPNTEGLLVSTTGIGFSTPMISIQRTLVVKRNRPITADALLKAAGVFQTKQFGAAKVIVNTKQGMKFAAKRYSFKTARTVLVTIKYRSQKNVWSERRLNVNVVK